MQNAPEISCTAFAGHRCIASGPLLDVALEVKKFIDQAGPEPVLVFDDSSGRQIELDLRGTTAEVSARLAPEGTRDSAVPPAAVDAGGSVDDAARRGPGRPKLGVVAREVTLLPRHWDWLSTQPGGASVALRKLVEQARRESAGRDRLRQAQESVYRFMLATAGDLPGFEEATRALFAANASRFGECIEGWPHDIRLHAKRQAAAAFAG